MALDSERAKKITLKGLFWEGRDARSFTTWRPRPEVGPVIRTVLFERYERSLIELAGRKL